MEGYRRSHLGAEKARAYDADLWDLTRSKGLTWALEQRLLDRVLDGLPDRPRTAVDFACGTGRVLGYLTWRGIDVTGVDVSPDMLTVARAHYPNARYVRGDVTLHPDLAPGPYDLATAFRFFLNAEPDLRAGALRWLRRVVRPGGHLIANFHLNPYSLRGAYTRLRQHDAMPPTMSVTEARHLLAAHGFRPVAVHGYDFLPFRREERPLALPGVRARVESALLGVPGLAGVAGTFVVVGERV